MPSLRNPLPRVDGETAEDDRVSASLATATCPDRPAPCPGDRHDPEPPPHTEPAAGDKARARDALAAILILKDLEREHRPTTPSERQALARFPGFGPLALRIFPDPVRGTYRDPAWRALGEELRSLLTPGEYDSARRSTFNAFYTPPVVVRAVLDAIARLGVPPDATVLEPGCGTGRFLGPAPEGMRFIGVELDSVSGRIARLIHPRAEIRIEDFRDSRLPEGRIDAAIGNVPFADIKLDYEGRRLSLHDFFFAKAIDALRPGGVLALITSHFTLDKQNASAREHLAERADFLGAIRLPSDAFKGEGTSVVADIVFLRKRTPGDPARHADPAWLRARPVPVEGAAVPINGYFLDHPEMMLGTLSRKDRLYDASYSLIGHGVLEERLRTAIRTLPEGIATLAPILNLGVEDATTAVPPTPHARHVTEGSFFVGDDRTVYQIEDGKAEPVTYCGVLLRADGTPGGRKFGSLIQLRDLARRVLQSQNEGRPEEDRIDSRKALNRAYDLFTSQHGPINKTTFTGTRTGTIRRMPNLVKFREDPDAMLVMSLEEYDEATGRAVKAPIMVKDVVGPRPPVTHVDSAEEGLLASLNDGGSVDLAYIAGLYGETEEAVVAELGDLIYRDPETGGWQTADAYLSGDVRAKLATAEGAGPEYARNAEALRRVQPEDVLPGDIDANLGAPWIPVEDIRAFAAELFRVPPEAFRVDHLEKDAVWSVEPDHRAVVSVAATADYGTSRVNGTELLAQALNLKTPVLYDAVSVGGRETRVMNPTETQAAREKQKAIKEEFRAWIFADPGRTERLVRHYNDTYNNLRPRLFDGSHLDFPGMSGAFALRPHQADAVWRIMSGGNTLLAHVVGAGKTAVMVAAGMKLKRAGLVAKPMFVVPNHMLEQFGREFLHLYPNARLLIAGKEDFTRERRKILTARIATGDWDGIIVTHSSFERIGMSRGYRERFLREQVAEYEALLVDKASHGRNIIKTLEKQKAGREERLKALLAEDRKDDGLVFDELGIDHVFVDEAHHFKNLETPTKMDRVAGIQAGGSERAFDLYMKCRHLDERHPGRGVTFATGTPISNTMVEMYTMQRFLDPEGLRDRGIEHFDAWAATFGEVVDAMEISPDGASLRPRSRFARFVNLPELVQMFRAFADVQTAEMLDLPRPRLEGGKPRTVACPMSGEQRALQAGLVERYDRLRSERVDPREDNALAITTDGRKLALDGRMLGAGGDFEYSKINALVGNVARIWRETGPGRGTQMVFCDLGVNPNPFSAYDEVVAKLVVAGIPLGQVAVVGEADSDAKKQALFEKVRRGTVRVLLGSTARMGTGTNVQRRLVALHHLDAPWKPAEVEQREGRILRQGNDNPEVAIYRYVTEGSFDAYMWQALETKARFIAQVMTGEAAVRRAEDVGGQELSYAEVKAIASGNPAVLTLAEADAELQRLAILRKNHADEQYLARRNLRDLPDDIRRLEERAEGLTADMATMAAHDRGEIVIGERPVHRDDVIAALGNRLDALPGNSARMHRFPLGRVRGLEFGLVIHALGGIDAYVEGSVTRRATMLRDNPGPRAVMNAVDRLIDGHARERDGLLAEVAMKQGQLRDFEARVGRPFAHAEYMSQLSDLRDRRKLTLSEQPPEGMPPACELAEAIRALRGSNAVEAAPQRAVRKAAGAERPVTARIRERSGSPASTGAAEPVPATAEARSQLPEPEPVAPVSDLPRSGPGSSAGVFRRRIGGGTQAGGRQMTLF